jgi:hypothetical protein
MGAVSHECRFQEAHQGSGWESSAHNDISPLLRASETLQWEMGRREMGGQRCCTGFDALPLDPWFTVNQYHPQRENKRCN